PIKQFYAGPDVYVCSGDTMRLSVDSLPGYRYEWGDLRYYFGEVRSGRPFYSPFIAMGLSNGISTYGIKVEQINVSTGCRYVDTIFITINPRIKRKITGVKDCVNDSTIYSYSTDSLPPGAYWIANGGEILSNRNEKSVSVKWNRTGKNTLTL